MICIKSRTLKGSLITHSWPSVSEMISACETEAIGAEIVQLVIENDTVLYSSLNNSDPFLSTWLRVSDVMDWFSEERNLMPWMNEPEELPAQYEIQPGDFSLGEDAEWKDMPDGVESFWLYDLKANRPLGELLGSLFEYLNPDTKVFISAIVRVGYDMIDSNLKVEVIHPELSMKEYRRPLNDSEKAILLSMIQKHETERLRNLYQATSAVLKGGWV